MREVVLDTETTGLDPSSGHRVVEIGCIELINHVPTDQTFHEYLDPERDMPNEAFQIHGLSNEFLKGQKKFAAVAAQLVDFLQDSKLVIHNAAFDIKFLNAPPSACQISRWAGRSTPC
jgi:DNA polymerase-3 subunit epsilon